MLIASLLVYTDSTGQWHVNSIFMPGLPMVDAMSMWMLGTRGANPPKVRAHEQNTSRLLAWKLTPGFCVPFVFRCDSQSSATPQPRLCEPRVVRARLHYQIPNPIVLFALSIPGAVPVSEQQ